MYNPTAFLDKVESLVSMLDEETAAPIIEEHMDALAEALALKVLNGFVREMNDLAREKMNTRDLPASVGVSASVSFRYDRKGDLVFMSSIRRPVVLFESSKRESRANRLLAEMDTLRERALSLIESDSLSLANGLGKAQAMIDSLVLTSPRLAVYTESKLLTERPPSPLSLDIEMQAMPEMASFRLRLNGFSPFDKGVRHMNEMERLIASIGNYFWFSYDDLCGDTLKDRLEDYLVSVLSNRVSLPLPETEEGVVILPYRGVPLQIVKTEEGLRFHVALNATPEHLETANRLAPTLRSIQGVDSRLGRILRGLTWSKRPEFGYPSDMTHSLAGRLVFLDITGEALLELVEETKSRRDDVLSLLEGGWSPEANTPARDGLPMEYYYYKRRAFTLDGVLYQEYRIKGGRRRERSRYFRDGKGISNRAFSKAFNRKEKGLSVAAILSELYDSTRYRHPFYQHYLEGTDPR